MRATILGFAAGTLALQYAARLPARSSLGLYAIAALCLLAASVAAHGRTAARVPPAVCAVAAGAGRVVAGMLLGYAWAALLAHAVLAPRLDPAFEGRDVVIEGIVDDLPHRFAQGVRFNFAVQRTLTPGLTVPPEIALSWYAAGNGAAGTVTDVPPQGAPPADVRPGERWRLTVRLQRPHGNANPGGFDYEAWLLEQGVRATGYVRAGPNDAGSRRLDAFVASPAAIVGRARAFLRGRIEQALAGQEYAAVIVALVIGDQRGVKQSDWQVFNTTGVSHLMSISGLHITMIAGLGALAVAWLWRRSFFTGAALPLRLPAQKAAALAGALVALAYVALAGFGVPAQRTLVMLSVVALALWTGRLTGASHVLCAALGAVLLLDPWAVLWPGFWLSFGAVAAMLFAGQGRIVREPGGARSSLRAAGRTQWAVTCGLVPLTMLLFGQVSLVSPIANAVAIPLVEFVVTPLALAGSLLPAPLCGWLLALAHAALAGLAALLRVLAGLPGAVWRAPEPDAWTFVLALGGTLWLLMPRGWPHRWTGAVAWLPLLARLPDVPVPGTFRVTAFDVGQGMALLVETPGHRLLYDTGPGYAPGADGGSRVILPYLRMRGIAALDGMVVSHGDQDHTGGALAVLEGVHVGWVTSSLGAAHPIVRAAGRHVRCAAGQRWTWDGVAFEMLHPRQDSYADDGIKTNARSCVLRVSNGRTAMLLAGDIEAPQEARLLLGDARLDADVLLAPHHGSGTSSTAAFLGAVHPTVGVFQVGWRNRYHHPKAAVYARYGALGIRRLRTDEAGAVTLDFGAAVTASGFRTTHARYWYGR
jgi:competence protein ComEC